MSKAFPLLLATLAMTAGAVSAARAQDAAAGEKKAAMCIGCHGIKGYQASFPQVHKVPMISGQGAKFIVSSLVAYKKGERKHPTMRSIAASLTDQDMADLGAYYEASGSATAKAVSDAAPQPPAAVAALLAKGACASCHGANYSKPIDPAYQIDQAMSLVNTCTLVRIVAVSNAGGVAPVGFVDVQPLVNQMAGVRTAVPHGVIYGLPYFRLQGGANAIILDPQVGDIGIAVFADHDISGIKASKAQNNPGSGRRFDMADGLYIGGVLNGAPTQYVQFSGAGVKIHSPTAVILDAPDVQITAATVEITATSAMTVTTPMLTLNGALTATGTITAPNVVGTTNVTFGNKSGIGHMHGGVQTGSENTGTPV